MVWDDRAGTYGSPASSGGIARKIGEAPEWHGPCFVVQSEERTNGHGLKYIHGGNVMGGKTLVVAVSVVFFLGLPLWAMDMGGGSGGGMGSGSGVGAGGGMMGGRGNTGGEARKSFSNHQGTTDHHGTTGYHGTGTVAGSDTHHGGTQTDAGHDHGSTNGQGSHHGKGTGAGAYHGTGAGHGDVNQP